VLAGCSVVHCSGRWWQVEPVHIAGAGKMQKLLKRRQVGRTVKCISVRAVLWYCEVVPLQVVQNSGGGGVVEMQW